MVTSQLLPQVIQPVSTIVLSIFLDSLDETNKDDTNDTCYSQSNIATVLDS